MHIINDIAYADNLSDTNLKIVDCKIVSELCMLITFSNNEKRIFDAKYLIKYPIYKELENYNLFKNVQIDNGILTWKNGDIDIGVEEVYNNSYIYEQELVI